MRPNFILKLGVIIFMVILEVGIAVLARLGLSQYDIDILTKAVIEIYIYIHGFVFVTPALYILFFRKDNQS